MRKKIHTYFFKKQNNTGKALFVFKYRIEEGLQIKSSKECKSLKVLKQIPNLIYE